MFTTRNVVLAVIVLSVISVGWSIWKLTRPPDSGGLASDSYGTRRHGLRAMYEILQELHVPVERGLSPPTYYLDRVGLGRVGTLVFWKPAPAIVNQEPIYLNAVGDWLRQGGRVVIASPRLRDLSDALSTQQDSAIPFETILHALNGPKIKVQARELSGEPPSEEDELKDAGLETSIKRVIRQRRRLNYEDDVKVIDDLLAGKKRLQPTRSMEVQATGSLAHLSPLVRKLELPLHGLQVLELKKSKPDGAIQFVDLQGNKQTLIAAYRIGRGELIYVGSGMIAENRLIAEQDNSVLTAQLIAGSGGTVVIDEFYHGLTVRGNPLWLFTRQGYGVVILCILGLAGLWIWRGAIFLGPPLPESIPSRRSIGEYVVAMATFLNKARDSDRFMLGEVRSGVLHTIRQELGLPPGREDVEELAAVMRRRNPQRAEKLIQAVQQLDRALSQQVAVREAEAIRLLQGISSCL